MLNSIIHTGGFSVLTVAAIMGVTLLLGIFIAGIYMLTGSYTKHFVVILSVMPVLISMVILVVNGNIGASVAVMGAFGLVRFRSAPGTARDIGFIFQAMTMGLAAGMGYISLAVIITLVSSAALLVLSKSPFGKDSSPERELKITIPENLNYTGVFDDIFFKYTSEHQLVRVKTTNMGTMYELVYRVCLRKKDKEKDMIDAIRCRNGNLTIIFGLVQTEKAML